MVASRNILCGLSLFSNLLSVLRTLKFMQGPVVLWSPPSPISIHIGMEPDDLA